MQKQYVTRIRIFNFGRKLFETQLPLLKERREKENLITLYKLNDLEEIYRKDLPLKGERKVICEDTWKTEN